MNWMTRSLGVAVFALFSPVTQASEAYVPGEKPKGDFKDFASSFLANHCFDCHDKETAKGDLNLVELGSLDETNAAVWMS
ncbi:MAG: hypothetical protein HOD72_06550, partial [Opitutae bacterium]|nr:hypothetical protein [Opitutae bacterium]